MKKNDAIRPAHYTGKSIEPIEVIQSWSLNFCLGNVIKYVARAGLKKGSPALEDLKKARQYLDFEIERIEQSGNHTHSSRENARADASLRVTADPGDAADTPDRA